jgi:hypothetical protein
VFKEPKMGEYEPHDKFINGFSDHNFLAARASMTRVVFAPFVRM